MAKSLSYLELAHPDVAELLMQQPWYTDGLSDSEKKFIEYGFGSGDYGISSFTNMDELMKKIIVNQQYVIDNVQLSQGLTCIVELYDRNDDPISKENVDLTMKLVKAYAPDVEQFEGARYPLPAIIVLAENDRDKALLEEEAHVIIDSRKGGDIVSKQWITEGIANFSREYIGEKLTQNPPSWWKSDWNTSVQAVYDSDLYSVKKMGVWEMPLANLTGSHYEVGTMGFLFIKDLHDVMGADAYTKMLSGIYDYQTTHPLSETPSKENPSGNLLKNMVDEKILEDYALKSSPNDAVKANVQKLFDARVWGTAN